MNKPDDHQNIGKSTTLKQFNQIFTMISTFSTEAFRLNSFNSNEKL